MSFLTFEPLCFFRKMPIKHPTLVGFTAFCALWEWARK